MRIVCAKGWGLVIFYWIDLSMRMQVILESLFDRRGSAPINGVKKGKFRDWNRQTPNIDWGAEVKKIQVI